MVSGERSGIGIGSSAKGGEMVEDSTRTTEELFFENDSNNQAAANTRYKDTVFRKLFRQKKELLELYNALNGSNYTKEEELEIVTLVDNSLFISMRNDLAFILDFRLHLYEHQSTPSPNMPLRDLFYVADLLQNYVRDLDLYGRGLVKIPAPRFIVFYNGRIKHTFSF